MSRASGSRGLVVVLMALLALAAIVDLLRPGSVILSAWRGLGPSQTPVERAVKDFTRNRPTQPPRTNRVEGGSTRGVIPPAQRHVAA